MTSATSFLLFVAVVGADLRELQRAQSTLESYYTQIKAVELSYTQRSVRVQQSEQGISRDQFYEMISKAAPREADQEALLQKLKSGAHLNRWKEISLLYAYPSCRINETVHDSDKTRSATVVKHNGEITRVEPTLKMVSIQAAAPGFPPLSPIDAIGFRIFNTLNMPVSELLNWPDLTRASEPTQVNGIDTICFTIGPNIPATNRPRGWNDKTLVTIWLAPEYCYIPMRMKVSTPKEKYGQIEYITEIKSITNVVDLSRGTSIPFPDACSFQGVTGQMVWDISDIKINPSISSSDFELAIPQGFGVLKHSRLVEFRGGDSELESRVNTTVQDARAMLEANPAPRRTWSIWPWIRRTSGLIAFVVLIVITWRSWRRSNAN